MTMPSTAQTVLRALFVLVLACASPAQTGQTLPTIAGETFAGRKVALPDATRGHVAVLIFGFTKASKESTSTWAEKVSADFASRDGFEMYQLPVLEEVPRLIRGMVISSIKKGVSENMRDHFMPVLQHESELKQLVSYKEPDDAYLVLLNRAGRIVKQQHGPLTEAAYLHFSKDVQSQMASE